MRFELTELLHSPVFKTGALNHSATLPKKLIATKTSTTPTAPAADRQSIFWCPLPDSNRPPTAYKAVALPDELSGHNKSWYFPLRLTLSSSQGFRRFINLVRMVGLEPTCFAARPPQDRVYTSFTTSALIIKMYSEFFTILSSHIFKNFLQIFFEKKFYFIFCCGDFCFSVNVWIAFDFN